jgi:NAD(P)-dependent dehydrogenase (short-subunit alcohol dehydrogenase family)
VSTHLSILVTGCSSGFGRLTSETLARRGHRVFASMRDVGGRNAAAAAELEDLARSEELPLTVLDLDVRDDGSVTAAIESAVVAAGRLDVLVNNAGTGYFGILETLTVEQARDLFETNVFSVLRLNRAVLPHMRERGSGLVVHVSSGLGRIVLPFNGLYTATKFALEAIAETYRYELACVGVDSIIVEPGLHSTAFFSNASANRPADVAREPAYGQLHRLSQDRAARRPAPGDPQDVADAIAALVELPAGDRPLRTTVGWTARRADRLNEVASELQTTVLDGMGLLDVVTLPRADAGDG